jgi:hypothetical protein
VALDHGCAFNFTYEIEMGLQGLEPFNCARYRLSIRMTEAWIARGRMIG